MKKPPPGRLAGKSGHRAAPAKKKAAPKKKPAAKKPPAGRPAGSGGVAGALGGVAAAAQKSILAADHQAHLAHLAHLAHIGQRPKAAPVHHRRQLALGEGVACCAAEALAASLRLAGRPVGDPDVLALYRRTASDPDTGASIVATLEAAARYGVAGYVVASFRPVSLDDPWRPLDEGYPGVILGVDLPGPHTVLDDGSSWWSWGKPYDLGAFPDAVIEEAWAVTWG